MAPRLTQFAVVTCLLSTPCLLHAQAPVGELYSTIARIRGSVTLAGGGTTVLSGSSIESGAQPARLALHRGGDLIVCQGTTVSVSASASGRDLMFSFGSGDIESHYTIGASSDSIITPDFRFVITGPGEFDLDVGISPQGDTCIRSHPESTGGVIVNEQMGDGTYQVKPSDFVIFHKGRVANAEAKPQGGSCGCPVAPEPVRQTEVAKAAPVPSPQPDPAPAAPASPPDSNQHVVAETPFVFNAESTAPPIMAHVMRLHVESNNAFSDLHPQVQPPPKQEKPEKKGFWHKLGKALFGS